MEDHEIRTSLLPSLFPMCCALSLFLLDKSLAYPSFSSAALCIIHPLQDSRHICDLVLSYVVSMCRSLLRLFDQNNNCSYIKCILAFSGNIDLVGERGDIYQHIALNAVMYIRDHIPNVTLKHQSATHGFP